MIVVLLIIAVLTLIGMTVVYARSRAPSSLDEGIEAFRREMDALAPRDGPKPQRRWWRR